MLYPQAERVIGVTPLQETKWNSCIAMGEENRVRNRKWVGDALSKAHSQVVPKRGARDAANTWNRGNSRTRTL